MSDEQFMSTAEAAAYLKVHPTTVGRWIRDGHLDAIHVGGKTAGYVIRFSDVKRLREKRWKGEFRG